MICWQVFGHFYRLMKPKLSSSIFSFTLSFFLSKIIYLPSFFGIQAALMTNFKSQLEAIGRVSVSRVSNQPSAPRARPNCKFNNGDTVIEADFCIFDRKYSGKNDPQI